MHCTTVLVQSTLHYFSFVFHRMPGCIFLHFEQGLKLESFQDLRLEVENGQYIMTQFIQYKRDPDHFICWTKEPEGRTSVIGMALDVFTDAVYHPSF